VAAPDAPLIAVRDLVKTYQALRPLRLEQLALARGELVALMGLDAPAAEMLVGLLTGAVLPDSGSIELFGRSTADIADSQAWLALLDGVGIVTDRAVLIAQFSVEQNIAMPFTLDIDPVASDVRPRVAQLAQEVGVDASDLPVRIAESTPMVQARVRLARALALDPTLLVAEHPTATLPRDAVKGFAEDMRRAMSTRGLGGLVITGDDVYATALGARVLIHEPASGKLQPRRGWRKLFGG
jgi:predicted ABC-type transport system involved in lysophospholipase L1 biosynthesis ATPase subunit